MNAVIILGSAMVLWLICVLATLVLDRYKENKRKSEDDLFNSYLDEYNIVRKKRVDHEFQLEADELKPENSELQFLLQLEIEALNMFLMLYPEQRKYDDVTLRNLRAKIESSIAECAKK